MSDYERGSDGNHGEAGRTDDEGERAEQQARC